MTQLLNRQLLNPSSVLWDVRHFKNCSAYCSSLLHICPVDRQQVEEEKGEEGEGLAILVLHAGINF